MDNSPYPVDNYVDNYVVTLQRIRLRMSYPQVVNIHDCLQPCIGSPLNIVIHIVNMLTIIFSLLRAKPKIIVMTDVLSF